MSAMRLGFMSSNCPNYSISDVAAACRDYGFQAFEPRIEWAHGHGIEPDAPAERVRTARRQLEDAGVEIPCISTGVHTAVPTGPTRRAALETVKRVAELCLLAGAPFMRVFGGGAKELDQAGRVKLAIETLAHGADALRGSGVQLLLETHDFFRAGRWVGQVVDAVDRPEVAVLWDTMHTVVVGESLEETLHHLKPERVKHTHFRDLYITPKAGGGYDSTYCDDYSHGTFPLREAHQILAEAGFDGTISLERIFRSDDPDHDAHAFLKAHGIAMRAVHQ